jgi:formiminotetrahydrofolate cyclodeaminase
MATTKPRITITLTKRQHEVLTAISAMGGGSMSAFVGEVLESALPTLERIAATFQKVKEAKDAERGRFIASMDRSQAAIESIVMESIGQFDLFMGAQAEPAAMERSAKRSDEPAAPAPTTNRGATPKRAKTAKPTAATVSGVSLPSKNSKTRRMPTA